MNAGPYSLQHARSAHLQQATWVMLYILQRHADYKISLATRVMAADVATVHAEITRGSLNPGDGGVTECSDTGCLA